MRLTDNVCLQARRLTTRQYCNLYNFFFWFSRPSHLKVKFTRACPIVRKRRSSARARPQVSNTTSEGDMAQADEMGEDGEREKDDGFVDGPDNVRRRIKKKPS